MPSLIPMFVARADSARARSRGAAEDRGGIRHARKSEIDAASVFFPVPVARRLRPLASTDLARPLPDRIGNGRSLRLRRGRRTVDFRARNDRPVLAARHATSLPESGMHNQLDGMEK